MTDMKKDYEVQLRTQKDMVSMYSKKYRELKEENEKLKEEYELGGKELKEQLNEQKLRKAIRNIISEVRLNEVRFAELYMKNDMKTKKVVSQIIKKMRLKIDKDYDVKALDSKGREQKFLILPKHRNDFLDALIQNNIKVRG